MVTSEIKYDVNTKNNTVTAIVTGCSLDVLKKLVRTTPNVCMFDFSDKKVESLVIDDKFVGTAHLNEGDKWNETIGRRVARVKLMRSYYRACKNALMKFNKELSSVVAAVNDTCYRYAALETSEDNCMMSDKIYKL